MPIRTCEKRSKLLQQHIRRISAAAYELVKTYISEKHCRSASAPKTVLADGKVLLKRCQTIAHNSKPSITAPPSFFLQIIERKKKKFMSTFETHKAINYVLKLP